MIDAMNSAMIDTQEQRVARAIAIIDRWLMSSNTGKVRCYLDLLGIEEEDIPLIAANYKPAGYAVTRPEEFLGELPRFWLSPIK